MSRSGAVRSGGSAGRWRVRLGEASERARFAEQQVLLAFAAGLAWEGLLRRRKEFSDDAQPMTPLPPVIHFVVYNRSSPWTVPLDVSELVAPASPAMARLQPSNKYVVLDMQRAEIDRIPKDNAVGLQVALEQATFEESVPILRQVDAVLAGPEHAGLRKEFAQWVQRSWDNDYGVLTRNDETLRDELA